MHYHYVVVVREPDFWPYGWRNTWYLFVLPFISVLKMDPWESWNFGGGGFAKNAHTSRAMARRGGLALSHIQRLLIDLKNNACFLHFCIIFQEVHTVQRKSLTLNCDIGHHPTLLLTVPSAEFNETQTEKLIKQMFHSVVEFKVSRYNTAAKFCS